uniref:Zinc knuckle CX2CX4HX4C domain-containing protein n=1 Tax=Cannabis sativa TaxID=3483 RepID=A0A803Q7D5_CANSA
MSSHFSSQSDFNGVVLHNDMSLRQFLWIPEKESTVHALTSADLTDENNAPKFFLVARCLSNAINPKTFIKKMGDFWNNNAASRVFRLVISPRCNSGFKSIFSLFLANPKRSLRRIRVWIDISQPLMRGKLVNLPHVRDEHWLEFQYENLPIFCFHCGVLGHPFKKCSGFLELVDAGRDPDLPYDPFMLGDKLSNSGYDRYRSDFSKANVYPFLTRLARKSIGSTIPNTNTYLNRMAKLNPHPSSLTEAENSTPNNHAPIQKEVIPELPSPFPSFFQSLSSSILTNSVDPHISISTGQSNTIPKHSLFATYPPSDQIVSAFGKGSCPIFNDATITSGKNKKKAITIDEVIQDDSSSGKAFKRQVDPVNFRSVLKRCRNNSGSSKVPNEFDPQQVSDTPSDSIEEISFSSSDVTQKQPRMEP